MSTTDYSTLTLPQLRAYARDLQIGLRGKTRKADIIAILEETLASPVMVAKPVKAVPMAPKTHPSYEIMIAKAIQELKERKGPSLVAIKKYIRANYRVKYHTFDAQFRVQVRNLVKKGALIREGNRLKLSDAEKDKLDRLIRPKARRAAKAKKDKTLA